MKINKQTYNVITCVIFFVFLATSALMAETVSQKRAKEMAQKFFDQAWHEQTPPVKLVYNGKRLTTDRLFSPFYVYNHPRGGFVIISGENKTFPILGYSLKSGFDPDKLTQDEKGWLKNYAYDIEMIRYDSRVPEEAIKIWTSFPEYVDAILEVPYEVSESGMSLTAVRDELQEIIYTPDNSNDAYFSAVYTPAQWKDLVDGELRSGSDVGIGFVDVSKNLYPAIINGRKGDFYRFNFGKSNDWMLRLTAAEFLGDRQLALLTAPKYFPESEAEEKPFEFYDSFIASIEETRHTEEAQREKELSLLPVDQPIVRGAGAGHFDIILPENARLAMIYNLNGSYIGRATYAGQPMAHVNIEAEPAGFYFAVIYGESGRPYGVKLYR